MGVPTLTCRCPVCTSKDPRDNRLRASVLLEHQGQTVVIDTTPDFRFQALRANVQRLDAVLFTHAHADHILGFDDIRPYNLRQKAAMPVFASPETIKTLEKTFSYIFDPAPAVSTIPQVTLHPICGPFDVIGTRIIPIPAMHGNIGVLGFRFGSAAYLTDFSVLPESSKPLLADLDDLVLDALRDVPHPMHQTVEQALAVVQELKPRRVWFTHIAHELPHEETNARLIAAGFPHVSLAYDGLRFEVRI
jgi:phosphoribosyl 1,2-cyclic phosphate phosphodiesterase